MQLFQLNKCKDVNEKVASRVSTATDDVSVMGKDKKARTASSSRKTTNSGVLDKDKSMESSPLSRNFDDASQSFSTSPNVFYSCASHLNSLSKVDLSRTTQENSQRTVSSSLYFTPLSSFIPQNKQNLAHDSLVDTAENEGVSSRLFQTPNVNPTKHYQTASASRIKFQSPLTLACDDTGRCSYTTPRRRRDHVSLRPDHVF